MEPPLDLDAGLDSRAVDLGAQAAKKLGEIGISTYRQLLEHFPRRYEDRRALPDYSALVEGETATIAGQVMSRAGSRSRRGMHLLRARLRGANGQNVTAVWFNQPWLEKQVYPGLNLILSGPYVELELDGQVVIATLSAERTTGHFGIWAESGGIRIDNLSIAPLRPLTHT